jgi:hypothetical protein
MFRNLSHLLNDLVPLPSGRPNTSLDAILTTNVVHTILRIAIMLDGLTCPDM